MLEALLVLSVALFLDLLFGEPPNRIHPVAWMGRYLHWGERHTLRGKPWKAFCSGAVLVLFGALFVLGVASLLLALFRWTPLPFSILAQALLLKTAFSIQGLVKAASCVRSALEAQDLPEARRRLGYHLVSRATADLDEREVAAATIESVAENLTDAVVAPLLFYALFDLPGALLYRFVNVADAVLGYRDPAHEYLGKAAAQLDDLLNLIPARVAALFIVLASPLAGEDGRSAFRIMLQHHRQTASPNAGWTMAAMAGALKVRLEKRGHYCLGEGEGKLDPEAIRRGVRVFGFAVALFLPLCFGLIWMLNDA